VACEKNFDAQLSDLVIIERGKISINAYYVHKMLVLLMGEHEVKYEFKNNAINFTSEFKSNVAV
jgi:hypothetical protein